MNWLDVFILAALSWGAYNGWHCGFARELCHTGAALAALVLAWRYTAPLTESVVRHVAVSPIVAWTVLFIGVLLGVTFMGHMVLTYLQRFFARLHPPLDRWGGGVFGTLKTLLVVTVLVVFAARLPWAVAQNAVGESLLALHMLSVAPALYEVVRVVLPGMSGLR